MSETFIKWMPTAENILKYLSTEGKDRPEDELRTDIAELIERGEAELFFAHPERKPGENPDAKPDDSPLVGLEGPICPGCKRQGAELHLSRAASNSPDGSIHRMSWCMDCGYPLPEEMIAPPQNSRPKIHSAVQMPRKN